MRLPPWLAGELEKLYTQHQVDTILNAYRSLFPTIDGPLAAYMDTNRTREWSYLTTNFHGARYEQFHDLHCRTRQIDEMGLGAQQKANALRAASVDCGVGFSIGFCPWTDDLLYRTYSPEKDHLTILVGHDWYPIVPPGRVRSDSPLFCGDTFHDVPRYHPAAPPAVLDNTTVALFLNLYPDYRRPNANKTGSLKAFEQCMPGLDAVIASVSRQFKTIQLVSWGADQWAALSKRVTRNGKSLGLMDQARRAPGKILSFASNGIEVPYLPLAHPSFATNFRNAAHLEHVRLGFAALTI